MRSFSKKLAFVLAAAMVVTGFAPAAQAKAADEMAINKSSQILYVNEGINHKGNEGVPAGKGNVSVYDFSVKNKPSNWKTAYSFAWSSSNEDVVTVKAGGVATAVGVGKATVYCKVTEKATKKVTTLKTAVEVKENAAKVAIKNADKYDGTTVEVNGVVDLDRVMYNAAGKSTTKKGTLVTDCTRWVAEPSKGVEINQSNGKFTFTEEAEAGDYTLYCETYQSSKYTKTTATSDKVVVTFVGADAFEVDQTASNGFNLLFNKAADIKIADVTVNKIIAVGNSTGKIPMVVSNVTMSEDKKTASVSLFSNFENGATYEISVKGYDDVATLTAFIGTAKTMTITSKSGIQNGMFVLTNTATDLTYSLFDEQGNDVTNTVNPALTYVVYSAANANTADYYVSGNSICIYKNGAEVAVNAEFHTGEFDNKGMEIVIKTTGYFIGMDKAQDSISEISFKVERYGNAYSNNQIPVNDFDVALKLKIKTTAQYDYLRDYASGDPLTLIDTTNGVNPQRVRFRSSNPDVLDIDRADGNKINLFKEGSAAILVDLVSLNPDFSENVVTIAAAYVTVVPKRVVTSVAVGGNATVVVGNVAPYNVEKIDLTIADQYGAPINVNAGTTDLTDIKYAINGTAVPAGSVTFEARSAANNWTNKIVVNSDVLGDNVFPAGKNEVILQLVAKVVVNEYRIDYAEREVRFRVVVKRPAGPETLAIELGNTTTGNVGRFSTPYDGNGNTEAAKVVDFKVFAKQNDVKTRQEALLKKPVDNIVTAAYATSSAVGTLFYSVTHNGQDVTAYTYFDGNTVKLNYSETAGQYMVANDGTVVDGASKVTYKTTDNQKDLGAGTYVFTLYKVAANSNNTRYTFAYVASASASVTCDTGNYTFVRRTSETATHTTNGVNYVYDTSLESTPQYGIWNSQNQLALRDCFEIKNRDGQNATTPFFVDAVDAENYVHVKSITFFEQVATNVYAPYTVNINVSLKK